MSHKDPKLISFGKRVKILRLEQGLSQEELAHRCGFYRTYIGMVERAERSITLCNVFKIAEGLKITMKELFDYEQL
ncbi:MAG: helix-turn-helix transcriptional regulator [Muribaculaceae bacterium]|nr:helix-turn-helix transcriptional regulator [Muribaculaceae bacterium]